MPTHQDRPDSTSNVVNHVRTQNFKIPASQIADTVKGLPDDQATSIRWLAQYCRLNNLGKAQLETLLKKPNGKYYGYDSVYALLSGGRTRRGENIQPICEAIETLREIETQRESLVTSGFIHTRLSSEIWQRCDKARLRQRIAYIFGDSQIGKTWALEEYARRNNHGQTLYVECPHGGSLGSLLIEIASKIGGISTKLSSPALATQIIASIDHTMLLIVDEAHRMLKTKAGLRALDFIRQLWNKSKCGIVLAMTNEGKDEFLTGNHAHELKQLWRRRIQPLQLPNVPPVDDLDLFADAYNLPPADDQTIAVKVTVATSSGQTRNQTHRQSPLGLQTEVVTEEGLGVWIMILQDASDIAQEYNRPITWGAVIKAYCLAQSDAEMIQ